MQQLSFMMVLFFLKKLNGEIKWNIYSQISSDHLLKMNVHVSRNIDSFLFSFVYIIPQI